MFCSNVHVLYIYPVVIASVITNDYASIHYKTRSMNPRTGRLGPSIPDQEYEFQKLCSFVLVNKSPDVITTFCYNGPLLSPPVTHRSSLSPPT